MKSIALIYAGAPKLKGEKNVVDGPSIREIVVNGTHQVLDGSYKFKSDITKDTKNEAVLSYLKDDGNWKAIRRVKWRFCKDMVSKSGKFHAWKSQVFKDLPKECPIKKGTRYRIKMAKIPIQRKNWNDALKTVIPSTVPAADRYMLDQFYYNKKGKKIGLFRVVFKLFEDKVQDLYDVL